MARSSLKLVVSPIRITVSVVDNSGRVEGDDTLTVTFDRRVGRVWRWPLHLYFV
jgi:hypothetical protein